MIEFKLPDIGEGIHEGVLLKWLVAEGDEVQEGDSICEVETDKVNAELPAPATGIIKKLNGKVGETIYVGDTLVVIDNGGEFKIDLKPITEMELKTEVVEEDNAGVVGALEVSDEVLTNSDEGRLNSKVDNNIRKKILATPVARKMAIDFGVNIEDVEGTGPMGRVMKADIQRFYENRQPKSLEKPQKTDAGAVEGEKIKLSVLRKTIAKKMKESFFTIPHTVVMEEMDVTELVKYRDNIKDYFLVEKDIKITYLPFIIKALILALKESPKFNSQLLEEEEHLLIKDYYHIGIAVDTTEGLLVPVIKDADQKGILALMEEVNRLGTGARDRKLKIEELKGSTFTITNYGSLGASFGTPIINYPEVAILGIGRINKKPVVVEDEIVKRWILPISLAFDHRVIDGGDAGRFLKSFNKYIKDPHGLLLR